MIIVVVGQESIPLPSLSSAPVSSSIDSHALLSLVTEGTVEHYWKEQVVSKIRQSLFRLPSGQSLLVRVLTVETWWNTQIRKQLMELSSRDPSLDQVKTDIVLWSLLFPKPGHLVTFCRAFAQLRRVQVINVRWEQPWVPKQLKESTICSRTPLLTELHILGSTLMSVCLSSPFHTCRVN